MSPFKYHKKFDNTFFSFIHFFFIFFFFDMIKFKQRFKPCRWYRILTIDISYIQLLVLCNFENVFHCRLKCRLDKWNPFPSMHNTRLVLKFNKFLFNILAFLSVFQYCDFCFINLNCFSSIISKLKPVIFWVIYRFFKGGLKKFFLKIRKYSPYLFQNSYGI